MIKSGRRFFPLFLLLGLLAILLLAPGEAFGKDSPDSNPSQMRDASTEESVRQDAEHDKKEAPPVYWIIPFIVLLLSIAILPLVVERWWESNLNKLIVALLCSLPVIGYYLSQDAAALVHELQEYFAFIVLLWSLFTISGGISLRGNLLATPKVNTLFLLVGAVLANFFGTTGAAMLLIRPLLTTNRERRHKAHIVIFFIFIVANCGGSLTPLADPPLFMGYLRGVPPLWTLQLWPMWLIQVAVLLSVFYVWDTLAYRKETIGDKKLDQLHFRNLEGKGFLNILWLIGVVCAILFQGELKTLILGQDSHTWLPIGETIMILMGALSLLTTKNEIRKANDFNFGAMVEVAALFIGIFMAMIPALQLLELRGHELGIDAPWQFMWASGICSSFLDNAPTYLVFASLGLGVTQTPDLLTLSHVQPAILKAVSIGSVFMGANTYIGNAPNFMVKTIAEHAGEDRVKMPSFFGYMLYALLILIPLDILITIMFFL